MVNGQLIPLNLIILGGKNMPGFPLKRFDSPSVQYLYLFLLIIIGLLLFMSVMRFLKLMDKDALSTPIKHYQADKLKKKHFSDPEILKYMRINYLIDAIISLIVLIMILLYEESLSWIIFVYLAGALFMKIVEKRMEWQ